MSSAYRGIADIVSLGEVKLYFFVLQGLIMRSVWKAVNRRILRALSFRRLSSHQFLVELIILTVLDSAFTESVIVTVQHSCVIATLLMLVSIFMVHIVKYSCCFHGGSQCP